MIKNFRDFTEVNEATEDVTVVHITSTTMYPIRIILPTAAKANVTVRFAHPNMGSTVWFELDDNGKINIKTTSTELDIVSKLIEVFNTWTTFYSKGAINSEMSDTMKVLETNLIFGKWWKSCLYKYRGSIQGKKYGI
jgi:hypothetical protein